MKDTVLAELAMRALIPDDSLVLASTVVLRFTLWDSGNLRVRLGFTPPVIRVDPDIGIPVLGCVTQAEGKLCADEMLLGELSVESGMLMIHDPLRMFDGTERRWWLRVGKKVGALFAGGPPLTSVRLEPGDVVSADPKKLKSKVFTEAL